MGRDQAVGTVTEGRNGKLKVELDGGTEVLQRQHGKDIDQHMVVDLRRLLTRAGLATKDQ